MLTLMGIGMLPLTPAYALTCADLWRGWVYASSGVLGMSLDYRRSIYLAIKKASQKRLSN